MIEILIKGAWPPAKSEVGKEIFEFLSSKGYSVSFHDSKITLFSKPAIRQKNCGEEIPMRITTKQ